MRRTISDFGRVSEYLSNTYFRKSYLHDALKRSKPTAMIDVGANSKPLLYDLNDDNLKDLIICNKGYFDNGNYNSKISLYKNTGTLTNPIFEFVTNECVFFSSLSPW